jgi:hypothetical protein
MSKLDTSIARFASSMGEIKAAQRHICVIELQTKKAAPGQTKKFLTEPKKTNAPKPTPKTATTIRPSAASDNKREAIIISDRKVAKKSKIGKLLGGKQYDFTKK